MFSLMTRHSVFQTTSAHQEQVQLAHTASQVTASHAAMTTVSIALEFGILAMSAMTTITSPTVAVIKTFCSK